ncbi:MAG: DUF4260 domain-containing protein [Caldilineaceae bacterium]|nr:DUF4260 domain-containing protein [Caldilineaceae bacterium]MBP8106758.1 DUF4260 domain-containing protein [Caldilineaceae bacterium]MBP8121014.1 DUF4260 domain-containing protein [Caldilineaceae bacterium]MBP9071771.1 DUF4260 domain-containing protein [Caldilineaceae bacterium]
MPTLIKLESLALFVLGIFLFSTLDYAWWWFPVLLLTPDLSMIGYVAGSKIGAALYNVVHHKGVGIGIYILGALMSSQLAMLIGVILFAHSAFDRIFGYGLKYTDAFQHTHLGWIGKNAKGEQP